jgi:hypothetical protein
MAPTHWTDDVKSQAAVEPHEQLVIKAPAIEDERELSLADDLADGGDDVGHGVAKVGRQLLVDI